MTGERQFLELRGVQRQTHKVYEPAVGKHTKTPNAALGRALREEQSRQRCLGCGVSPGQGTQRLLPSGGPEGRAVLLPLTHGRGTLCPLPLYSSSLAKQRARFRRESTDLK